MSTTAPSPLLSESLKGLGIDAGTLFFALNYDFTKIESKGLLKRFKKNKEAIAFYAKLYRENHNYHIS